MIGAQLGRYLVTLSAALLMATPAFALTTLKKVQVTDGDNVELIFDEKVSAGQIKVEYINDIVQISLNDVSVYPAKIFTVAGKDLVKVFAYQYSPKLVRCRLTVKGKAENFKDRIAIKADGKSLQVAIAGGGTDKVVSTAAAPKPESKLNGDEKLLLERVMKSEAPKEAAVAKAEAKESKSERAEKASAQSAPIAGGKGVSMGSAARLIGTTIGMLALLGMAFMGVRRLRGREKAGADLRAELGKGFAGLLKGKFMQGLSGIGDRKRNRPIEVIANHYLGPKKSISVVKVFGRTLVLGVTNDSINLIAQFSGDGKAEVNDKAYEELDLDSFVNGIGGTNAAGNIAAQSGPSMGSGAVSVGPVSAGGSAFSNVLEREKAKPGVRAQIKSRLENLKQL